MKTDILPSSLLSHRWLDNDKARDLNIQNMFTSYSHEKYGKVKTVSPVVKMSETPPKITRPAPLVGEHGYEILEEFGYSKNEIEKFENEKIISVERVEK